MSNTTATTKTQQNIVIVGLGLIGGSLAKAISANTPHRVTGADRSPAVMRDAIACGAIRGEADDSALLAADVVILCLYPQDCIDFVKSKGDLLQGKLVTDTCGVKIAVCGEMTTLAEQLGFTFVGGHPMAGKEKNGFSASDALLFQNASYLLVPCGAPQAAVDIVETLATQIGATRVITTTPEHHDEMIAFTSQVPHALACAYVSSPLCLQHPGYSAGSYRDVSRVARINEELWSELFLDNREPLVGELDVLLTNLSKIRNAVAQNDKDELRALLRQGREIKERLGE